VWEGSFSSCLKETEWAAELGMKGSVEGVGPGGIGIMAGSIEMLYEGRNGLGLRGINIGGITED